MDETIKIKVEDTNAYQELESVKRSDLDPMEQIWYDKFIKQSSHKQTFQIIINTAEGDYSQLSMKLSKIAEAEDNELGIKN